jgi:hypothetical protein
VVAAPAQHQLPQQQQQQQQLAVLPPNFIIQQQPQPDAVVGLVAHWSPQGVPTKFPLSFCWRERLEGCQKACCIVEPGSKYALLVGVSEEEKLGRQRKDLSKCLTTLRAIDTQDTATLTEWAGVSYNPARIYKMMTVAQQLLLRIAFRWFAGFTTQDLNQMWLPDQLHPKMLTAFEHGRFYTHSLNWLHLKGEKVPVQLQKFAVLARSGEICCAGVGQPHPLVHEALMPPRLGVADRSGRRLVRHELRV